MSGAWTPGPWRVDGEFEGDCVVGDTRDGPLNGEFFEPICRVFRHGLRKDANARLIAAAPDLHHCTKLLESLCEWLLQTVGADSPAAREATFRLDAARRALSAAEGGGHG